MNFSLFTYPNCLKCAEFKKFLKETDFDWREYSLVLKEGKTKIREFIKALKRDDKGSIVIPTLVIRKEGEIAAVLNSRQELEDWLKSKG